MFFCIALQEWGAKGPPHIFKGSYRLEHDHSWTPVSRVEEKDDELRLINKILDANKAFSIMDESTTMSVDY